MLAEAAEALAAAVERELGAWVVACVRRRLVDESAAPPFVLDQARRAGEEAALAVAAGIRDLGGRTPGQVLRSAVEFPARVLRDAGVPAVPRSEDRAARFPDDDYDLTPDTFADVSPELHELWLRWSAAKVMEHKAQHAPPAPDSGGHSAPKPTPMSSKAAGGAGAGRVVAYVPDLMDQSRFGGRATFVRSPGELAAAASPGDVVVVDLSRPGVLEALAALPDGVRTIGFGSHVERELLAAATAAGCQTVLPRSKFFATLPTLLA